MRPALIVAALCAFAAGSLPALAEGPEREVAIADPALIATPEARERLKYLATCALAPDTVLVGQHDGAELRFPGALALAPDWANRALTETERRWVSACILAHTNAFGANVLVSMRADPAPTAGLETTPEERASHTIYEAGYFGDIFADPPRAYACAAHDADSAAALERRFRVCSLPLAADLPVSQCGFLIMEPCPAGAPPSIDGNPWPEVVHVWLDGEEPS